MTNTRWFVALAGISVLSLANGTVAHAQKGTVTIKIPGDPVTQPARGETGDPDALYQAGNEAYSKADYSGAVVYFTRAISARAKFSAANFDRGISYEGLKNWTAALADFSFVLHVHPTMYDAYVERGRCLAKLEKFDAAYKDFAMAVSLKPKRVDAYLVRAEIELQQVNYDRTIADCTVCLEVAPKDFTDLTVYKLRGIAEYRSGRRSEAITDLALYVKGHPEDTYTAAILQAARENR